MLQPLCSVLFLLFYISTKDLAKQRKKINEQYVRTNIIRNEETDDL